MNWRFIGRNPVIVFVIAISFILSACIGTRQPAPIMTPSVQPTSRLPEIDLEMDLPEGDAESGAGVAISQRCQGCHNPVYDSGGPFLQPTENLPGMVARGELRITSPDYTGRATTYQEYMLESIFLPQGYIVPGEWEKVMVPYNPDSFSDQELADLLAWMITLE